MRNKFLVTTLWHLPALITCWYLLQLWGIANYYYISAVVVAGMLLVFGLVTLSAFFKYSMGAYAPPNLYLMVTQFARANGFNIKKLQVTVNTDPTDKPMAKAVHLFGYSVISVPYHMAAAMPAEQLMALAAHELGHVYYRHHLKTMLMVICAWCLRIVSVLFFMHYAAGWAWWLFIPAVLVLNNAIDSLYQYSINRQRRQYEYQADNYAAIKYNGQHLISALVSMGINAETDTHPATDSRIQRIRQLK